MPDDPDADDSGLPASRPSDRDELFGRRSIPDGFEQSTASETASTPDAASPTSSSSLHDIDAPIFPPATPSPSARVDSDGDGDPRSGVNDGAGATDEGSGTKGGSRSGSGSVMSFFRELPVLLLVAFLLAFLLRTFVLQVFYIPSGSMQPTLEIDDRMVVEKLTYLFRDPVRGEIVVFEGESLGSIDPDVTAVERVVRGVGQFIGVVPASARDFVKRVIGLPGDEIEIIEGEVRVNGELLDEPYVAFEDPSDYGPVTVPDDSLFFLGDNRPNSSDSRRGLGFVPLDAVVGRSVVIIWPFGDIRSLTGVEHDVPAPTGSTSTPEVEGGGSDVEDADELEDAATAD